MVNNLIVVRHKEKPCNSKEKKRDIYAFVSPGFLEILRQYILVF